MDPTVVDPASTLSALDVLVKFQASIAAILGFTGVVVTLIVNARNARRQVEDNRRHDQDTLRKALLAELEMHRETMIKNAEQIRNTPDHDGMYHPILTTPIFDQSMSRLGSLELANLKTVLKAFRVVEGFNRRLEFISVPETTEIAGTREVSAAHVKRLLRLLETALPPVDAGIAALSGGA